MRTFTKCLAAAAGIAALGVAAPASAQFFPGAGGYGYPGYGYPGYGYGGYGAGAVIGSIINSVAGGGYGGYGAYNVPGGSRIAASQCTAAVQQRLGGYAYGGGYGRVLSINSVEIRGNGGYTVRGLASAGGYAAGGVPFSCRTDPRGFVTHVGFNSGYRDGYYGNGYNVNANPYYGSTYNNPYAVYGYSRY
jgi:hypothetical protein